MDYDCDMTCARLHARWVRWTPPDPSLIISCLMLAACATASTPARTVEQYVQAQVKGDANAMIALSCAAWEPQARLAADSIKSRNPKLEGLSCKDAGADGAATLVACTGKIITSYGGESREVNLAERAFKLVDGKVCGFK